MNWTKYLVTAVAVFVFIFLYDWVVHGWLLSGMYQATASVWRQPPSVVWMVIGQICYSLAITYLFARKMKKGHLTTQQCTTYGMWLGVFLGAHTVGCYSYLPVPGMLVFWWVIAAIVAGAGVGWVVSLTYKK